MARFTDFCNSRKIISVHCFSLETIDPAATVHCRDFLPPSACRRSLPPARFRATGRYLVLNVLDEVKEPETKIVCEQGHILRRPSTIHVEVTTDSGRITCVRVGGSAATVIRGTIAVEG